MSIRVIAGSLKRRQLKTVPGINTRPTSDRLRETIFNIAGDSIRGAHVLDLFSGTGAMGIEALSRGAAHSVMVDNSQDALAIIRQNISSCKLEDRSSIIRWDIQKSLKCLKTHSQPFSWIYIDPPYNTGAVENALAHLSQSDMIADHATVVVEHTLQEPIPDTIEGLTLTDQRKYGKTLVSFLCPML